ncbi:hypothetical protein BU15DRAFT_68932 [Melanogaster broomeanus]|nr:hypothetical protein BU15DRAFT_68932 [Melanogaster broomeanus]
MNISGLSEVLSGLGVERLEGLLPDIIVNAQSPRSIVREGFMSLLVYLPGTFGNQFQPHLPKITSPTLSGLSGGKRSSRSLSLDVGHVGRTISFVASDISMSGRALKHWPVRRDNMKKSNGDDEEKLQTLQQGR